MIPQIAILLALTHVMTRVAHVAGQNFWGTLATNVIGNLAQSAAQQMAEKHRILAEEAAKPDMPSVAEQQRVEAIQRAKMNQVAASEAQSAVKDELDAYKQLEQDLAIPLADKTSTLKAERLSLMRRISTLTNEIRAAFDSLHPDLIESPLIIVAKTPDDDMRAATNKIDALGTVDELQGLLSPCAQFHLERSSKKKELDVVAGMNNLDEEARALSRMSPEERIAYDQNMAEEYRVKKRQLRKDMRKAEREASRQVPMTGSSLLGGFFGAG